MDDGKNEDIRLELLDSAAISRKEGRRLESAIASYATQIPETKAFLLEIGFSKAIDVHREADIVTMDALVALVQKEDAYSKICHQAGITLLESKTLAQAIKAYMAPSPELVQFLNDLGLGRLSAQSGRAGIHPGTT